MKIAIFTNNYLPNPFGISKSILSFRKELEKSGHEFFIFAPESKGFVDEFPNVFRFPSIDYKYKIRFPLPISFSNKFSKLIKEEDFDLIHTQHPNLLGWTGRRWAKKKNIPHIFTWHSLYDQYVHFAPSFFPKKFSTWWVKNNAVSHANKADCIIVPTGSVKKIIKEWGVTNKNIEIIPTGVETDIFKEANGRDVRKRFGIKEDDKVLLIVARISPEKNIGFIFESLKDLIIRRKDVKLMVAGGGSSEEELKLKASEWGLQDQIIFTGLVGENEKKHYYAVANIFVYASKSETQGMVLSEAMYMGVPIVAVKAPGSQDLVMDGASGFLVDEDQGEFSSAAERLLLDESLCSRFSENSIKLAEENYTSEVSAKKLLEVYKKTIRKKQE